jgi:AcrR family transcriptional regulator
MRERILDGARACLMSGGFASKRLMSAIARHAGVARTTLYRYSILRQRVSVCAL